MGVVYRAVDSRLGRQVAVKVLPPEASPDPDRRRRFVQEARAASALNHPNIVTIYEIDEHADTIFIAMELVEGTPLDTLLAKGRLPVATALDYAMQIASALVVGARRRHRPSRHQAGEHRHYRATDGPRSSTSGSRSWSSGRRRTPRSPRSARRPG